MKTHYLKGGHWAECGISNDSMQTTSNLCDVTCRNCLKKVARDLQMAVLKVLTPYELVTLCLPNIKCDCGYEGQINFCPKCLQADCFTIKGA